jgi:hypothetical protein
VARFRLYLALILERPTEATASRRESEAVYFASCAGRICAAANSKCSHPQPAKPAHHAIARRPKDCPQTEEAGSLKAAGL